MAILGVGYIEGIEISTSGKFNVNVYVVSNDGASQGHTQVNDISMASVTEFLLNTALVNGVKAYMTSDLGFTFGLLDTVRILGGTLF